MVQFPGATITYPTGEVSIGRLAFKGATSLQATVFHEIIHQYQALSGKQVQNWSEYYGREVEASVQTLLYADRLGLVGKDYQDELDYLLKNMEERKKMQWLGK